MFFEYTVKIGDALETTGFTDVCKRVAGVKHLMGSVTKAVPVDIFLDGQGCGLLHYAMNVGF